MSLIHVGKIIPMSGCITEFRSIKSIMDKPYRLARVLGFSPSYLQNGYAIMQSIEIPASGSFELGAYTNILSSQFKEKFPKSDIKGLEPLILKKFERLGPHGLGKVIRLKWTKAKPDDYVPGLGVPQWVLKEEHPIDMKVIGVFP